MFTLFCRGTKKLIQAALLAPALTSAHATVITLNGTSVNYTFDDSLLGLFGPATISGNTLSFSPGAFKAQSLNGSGIDFQGQTINVLVTPKGGQQFTSLAYREQGQYLQQGEDSLVDAGGQLRIFDPSNPLAQLTPPIAPDTPFATTPDGPSGWQASILADIDAFSNAASLNVTIENLLFSMSFAETSSAAIEKDLAALTFGTHPVPEGNSLIMLLIGMGLLGLHLNVFQCTKQR